jgi:hypothetical protein
MDGRFLYGCRHWPAIMRRAYASFLFQSGYGYKKSEQKKSARAYGVISGLPAIPLCLLRDLCGLQTKKLNIPLHPFPFGSADS